MDFNSYLTVTVLCVPMTIAGKVYRQWVYGEVLCKMTPYLQGVSVTTSTFTITAMSLDRCLAILHPMKLRNLRTKRNVRILIGIVWMTSVLLMIPLLFVNKTKTQQIFKVVKMTLCIEEWSSQEHRRAYDFSLLFVVCLFPAQIVFVSYVLMGKRLWVTDAQLQGNKESKFIHTGCGSDKNGMDTVRASRRRIAKMCIVVSIVFVVCWLPYYTVNIYLDFKRDNDALDIVYWGLLIGHLHCITNPILYCFMHKTFRHCVMRLLSCRKSSRFLRSPSGYGTTVMSRNRKGSLRSPGGSSRRSLDPENQHFKRTPSTSGSRKSNVRFGSSSDCDATEAPIRLKQIKHTEDAVDSVTSQCKPRKVKLLFSRFRDRKTLCNSRPNSFKLIELQSSIQEESQSQPISEI